jgi:hypothetical protein
MLQQMQTRQQHWRQLPLLLQQQQQQVVLLTS